MSVPCQKTSANGSEGHVEGGEENGVWEVKLLGIENESVRRDEGIGAYGMTERKRSVVAQRASGEGEQGICGTSPIL